jgi:tetratricopeptide (TPR) repeat protein
MDRLRLIVGLGAALWLGAGLAVAKPKGTVVTERDVLTCNGSNGSTSEQQIAACTKLLSSGKIKHPHEGDFYAMRAAAYFALKQHDKALADLNKALTYRQTQEIYFQRALLHITMKNPDGAKADLAQVMKLKPEFAPAYFMRGLIAYDAGDYKEAVTYFDGAVQRMPTYYQALYARGVAKKKAGDEKGGEKDIKDAKGMSSHVEGDMEKLGFKP